MINDDLFITAGCYVSCFSGGSFGDSCWDFAQKAYIYRKLGNQDMFKEFYKKAEALCPGNAALKRLYENKNYYSDFYMQKKKAFNF